MDQIYATPNKQIIDDHMGLISLILSIIGLIVFIAMVALLAINNYFGNVLYYPVFMLSIFSIIFGSISYFGSRKDRYGFFSLIIGIIIICIAPTVSSIVSYFTYYGMMGGF